MPYTARFVEAGSNHYELRAHYEIVDELGLCMERNFDKDLAEAAAARYTKEEHATAQAEDYLLVVIRDIESEFGMDRGKAKEMVSAALSNIGG